MGDRSTLFSLLNLEPVKPNSSKTQTHFEAKQILVTETEGLREAKGKSYPEENATHIKLEQYFETEYEKGTRKKYIKKKSKNLEKKKKLKMLTLPKPVEEEGEEFSFIDESNVKDVTTELFNSSIGEARRKRLIVSNIDLPERIKTLLVIENPVHTIEFGETAKGAPLMLFDNFKYLINKITTSVNS